MLNNQLNWAKNDFENIDEAWKGDLWSRELLGIQHTSYVDRLQCGALLALDTLWSKKNSFNRAQLL